MGIGVAHFFARRFEEARATLRQSLQEKPNWVPSYRFLASCYAHMGRLDEAHETVKLLRTMTNVVVPTATIGAMRNTASCSFPACAWRSAKPHEPDPMRPAADSR
jgi:hypothetical protein